MEKGSLLCFKRTGFKREKKWSVSSGFFYCMCAAFISFIKHLQNHLDLDEVKITVNRFSCAISIPVISEQPLLNFNGHELHG